MSVTHDDVTRAARTMIDVEPASDLEARIKARLDAVTTAATPRHWPLAAGLATAAVLTIVVMLSRSSEVPEFRGSEVPEFRSAEVRNPGPSEPRNFGTPALRNLGTSERRNSGTSNAMSETEREWMTRRIPALDLIEPIQPEPVSITPLTMTPLVTPPVFGDPDTGRQ